MPDEIDLLRRFREDTPGPDDAAWECARTAVVSASRPAAARAAVTRPGGRRRWRLPARGVAVVGVVAGTAAGLVAVAVQERQPTLSHAVTTAWEPARPLPASGQPARAGNGTWRLTSYLEARGWQQNTAGMGPGALSCPTAATCYVEGDTATSPSGPANMNSLYVTTDGARSWSVLPVPAHVTFTSALACPAQDTCAAGGLYSGHQPVYLSTGDGGHSWTVQPLARGTGQIGELSCTSSADCRGLAGPPGSDLSAVPYASLVTTRDGGQHWTAAAFPAGDWIESVNCPATALCVAAGAAGPQQGTALVLVSHDGGITWRRGIIHGSTAAAVSPDVTCTDTSHCYMLGFYMGSSSVTQQYSVFDTSTDGGVTWTASTFPASIPGPYMMTLDCPATGTCYAAGGDRVSQRIGQSVNEDSSVIAVTHDGGLTWQRFSFAVPAKVPSGMSADAFMSIGQIECPQPDACTALPASDQGSTSTAVYTNHG